MKKIPTSSTIGKKQSDYVGEIFLNLLKNLELNYDYS